MIKISRPQWLSSTVVFLYLIFGTFVNIVKADSLSTDAAKIVDSAITIDAENLIEIYRSIQDVTLIDSRLSEDRVHGYIEKSRSLPLADTDCLSLADITDDKDRTMVFYDNGMTSEDSAIALTIAANCGYYQLFWFSGGFAEWEDKDYPFVIE